MKGAGLLAASSLLGTRVGDEYPLASALACALPTSPARLAVYVAGLTVVWLWGVHDAQRSARPGAALRR